MARKMGDFETALRLLFETALNNPPDDLKEALHTGMREIPANMFPRDIAQESAQDEEPQTPDADMLLKASDGLVSEIDPEEMPADAEACAVS